MVWLTCGTLVFLRKLRIYLSSGDERQNLTCFDFFLFLMGQVKIPCPLTPDCLWRSIPLEFDKAVVLVEQHLKYKHPSEAEASCKGDLKIIINFNTDDVTSLVETKESSSVSDKKLVRKRGRPPKNKNTDHIHNNDEEHDLEDASTTSETTVKRTKKEKPRKLCQQYNGEGAKPYLSIRDDLPLGEDDSDFQATQRNGKIIPPRLKTSVKGGFELGSGGGKGLQYEQVSIDENYPGLMDCLNGSRPYMCVVASCNQRTYPNMGSMRQHYIRRE